jgi:hypothetical protein
VMWLSKSNWPVWSAVNSTPRRHQPLEQGDERGPLSQHLRVLEEQPADDLRVDGAGGRFDLVEAGTSPSGSPFFDLSPYGHRRDAGCEVLRSTASLTSRVLG